MKQKEDLTDRISFAVLIISLIIALIIVLVVAKHFFVPT
jgi:hypothetical protein